MKNSHTTSGAPTLPSACTLCLVATLAWGNTVAFAQSPAPTAPVAVVGAVETPSELNAYALAWIAKGSGVLRFFGFKAYDATLWIPATQSGFELNRTFALDIRYNASVKAADIVNTSMIEMTRIASATPEQVKAWTGFMTGLFVDVKSGDRLVGVRLPEKGARFFLNGKLLGETPDEGFSDAFFRIWLDPKTSRPALRDTLLGTTTPPPRTP